jgi:DNA-binding transcriptional regulator YiaG
MPNIAVVIKAEIARLAKKEAKCATSQLKRASGQYRSDIAMLKKRAAEQDRIISDLKRELEKQQGQPSGEKSPMETARFSARSVKAQRQRLGLSAADYGKLVGVSGLTIFNWEHGMSRPRQVQLAALVAVRNIGKREALKRLARAGSDAN